MEILVITEKPEISRVLPKAFNGSFRNIDNVLIGTHEGIKVTIIATDGHILRLQQPQEIRPELKWHTPQFLLPLPDRPGLLPESGKAAVTKSIRAMGRRADEVIICTDPDMEGELIGQDVANYCGVIAKSTRMLLNKSLDPVDVLAAFNGRTPIAQYLPRYRAGQYKRESDWYWMYLVRAHTFAARNGMAGENLKLERDDKRVLSCGRVQGVILRLVCEWHLLRKSHIHAEYAKLNIPTEAGTMAYIPPVPDAGDERVNIADSGQVQIMDIAALERMKSELMSLKTLEVAHIIKKKIPEGAPPPFDSTGLLQAMSKQYKWPLKKTAAVADKVRFKGLITYFRTDDHRLPTNYLDRSFLNPILAACADLPGMPLHVGALETALDANDYRCRHVTEDDLDHQGITPSGQSYLDKNLSEDEYLLYEMVARRFVMSMMPRAVKQTTWVKATAPITGVLDENPSYFVVSETVLIESGWRGMKESSSESLQLPYIPERGEAIGIGQVEVVGAVTQPKAPMQVVDLLQQLKSPSMLTESDAQLKLLRECRGVGTAATRPATYEKTKKRGYMLENDNNQISPTRWGLEYLQYLHPDLVSVGLTERAERAISEISKVTDDSEAVRLRDNYLKVGRDFITKHIEIALESD